MTDNVIDFPGTKQNSDLPEGLTADEILDLARGRFDSVIIIGSSQDKAQCLSSLPINEAIFELSRAIHILHKCLDEI